jgi:hypothetical protein
MTIANVIASLPGGAAPVDQVLLRAALISGLGHFIEPDTDPQTVDVVDAGTGALPWIIGWHKQWWWLDPDDTTSAHDGTTVIVTDDGGRYKIAAIDPWHGYGVISATETTPPDPDDEVEEDRPSLGDAYIVPSGASGDWGDHADDIAIWTARGWGYVPPRKWRQVGVDDEGGYRHWSGTAWALGLGNNAHADASIAPVKLVQGLTFWIVQEVGLDTPPSIVKGINYIVGATPSGAFVGHTNEIATSDDGIGWDFYEPAIGWEAFNLDDLQKYRYNGASWESVTLGYASAITEITTASAGLSAAGSNSSGYAIHPTTPPTQSTNRRFQETLTRTIQADFVGQRFEVEYQASVTGLLISGGSSTDPQLSAGIFIDSVADALDWHLVARQISAIADSHQLDVGQINLTFEFALEDTSAHTLRFYFFPRVATNLVSGGTLTVVRRRTIIRKKT